MAIYSNDIYIAIALGEKKKPHLSRLSEDKKIIKSVVVG